MKINTCTLITTIPEKQVVWFKIYSRLSAPVASLLEVVKMYLCLLSNDKIIFPTVYSLAVK
jgi:hypothetical protein